MRVATPTFQYVSHHVITGNQLAPPLRISAPSWTEVANGAWSFSGSITVPKSAANRETLRAALEPDDGAIYIRASNGGYAFGGPIIQQEWNRKAGTVAITAVSWRSWLFSVFLAPKVDLTSDNTYTWLSTDQITISQNLITLATAGGLSDGRPTIAITPSASGKIRDLSVKGLDFRYIGEWIDSMAKRSGGFEWDISVYPDNATGLPRLRFQTGFPQIGGLQSGISLRLTPRGGNMTILGTIARSSTDRRTRVWATGNTETSPFAVDSDPALASGSALLREKVTNYSTVKDRGTLSSHARAERGVLSPRLNFLRVRVEEKTFDTTSYRAGDRVPLRYKDDWYDIDMPAVRIVERKVEPRAGAGFVELLLDLVDDELPEVDTGGFA